MDHVFEFFQGVGQDGWLQVGAWDPHHQKECSLHVHHIDDGVSASGHMVFADSVLLVDVRCLLWALVVHQEDLQTIKDRGFIPRSFFP